MFSFLNVATMLVLVFFFSFSLCPLSLFVCSQIFSSSTTSPMFLVVHLFKLKDNHQMVCSFFLSAPGLICPVEKAFVLNDLQLFQRSFPASSVFSIAEL